MCKCRCPQRLDSIPHGIKSYRRLSVNRYGYWELDFARAGRVLAAEPPLQTPEWFLESTTQQQYIICYVMGFFVDSEDII